jgi:hypothetical protein
VPTWVAILLAVLAPGGIITVLLERMRRENNRDHATNSFLLRKIDKKVDRLDERIDDHMEWHAHKE